MGEFYGDQYTDSEYNDYNYEDLVDDVVELAEELGEAPTTRDAESDGRFLPIAKIYDLMMYWAGWKLAGESARISHR